jgi:hypothetical protein
MKDFELRVTYFYIKCINVKTRVKFDEQVLTATEKWI